ncbi:hypothetical protein M495_12220 [Serratia liquefaciens ATCC 27592]|nr:hypothetical protein M495_12220 [Serratia liquefaciens ATCC 27592]
MMMKEQVLQKENPWGRVVRLRTQLSQHAI